jgi:CubicO group peptidase (beta-lactamase class C family)
MNDKQTAKLKDWAQIWLEEQRRLQQIPGISYCVFTPGKILVKGSLGYADLTNLKRIDPDHTLFRIASISKSITALAIAKLVAEGRLGLDDPVTKYLEIPELRDIKIKHLLAHTSGIRRDLDIPFWLSDVFPDHDDLFKEMLKGDVCIFKPDKKYKYSNLAYAILGLVIAVVSSSDYEQYIKAEILAPLGLSHIYPDSSSLSPKELKNLAVGYSANLIDAKLNVTRSAFKVIDTLSFAPAVGYVATATDLAVLISEWSLKSEKLVPNKIKQLFLKPRKVEAHPEDVYALGLKVVKSGKNVLYEHGGSFAGYRSYYAFSPKHAVGAIVMTNSMNDAPMKLAEGLINMQIKIKNLQKIDDRFKHYEGIYANRWGDYHIISLGSRLYYYDLKSEDPAKEIIEIAGNVNVGFVDSNAPGNSYKGEKIAFDFTAKGGIKQVRFGSSILYPKFWN